MKRSETLTKLAPAIVKAQGQIDGAIKNAKNPHLKNRYADLGAVWDACREALQANSLAVLQMPCPSDDGRLHLETVLMHESGEYIASEIALPLPKQDPQGAGSAITYARRYGLAAMLGIVQEDDDGEAASQRPQQRQPAAARKPFQELEALLAERGYSPAGFAKWWNKQDTHGGVQITDLDDIPDGDWRAYALETVASWPAKHRHDAGLNNSANKVEQSA